MAEGPIYRVWEVENTADDSHCLIAVSNVREVSLRQDIEEGRYTMRLVRIVAETRDRNEAREMAGGAEM